MSRPSRIPVIQAHGKAASHNFVNVGATVSRAVSVAGVSDAGARAQRSIEVKKGGSGSNSNLYLLDRRVRQTLEGNPKQLELYKSAVRAIICSYGLLVPYRESDVIEERGTDAAGTTREQEERKDLLVGRFVEVARRFADVVCSDAPSTSDDTECDRCEGELEERNDMLWCPRCLLIKPAPLKRETAVMAESSSRNINDKLNHFRQIPQSYQGKEEYDITAEQLEAIEAHAERYEIDLERVSKDTLLDILDQTGLSDELRDHINLLHYTLTGVSPPDISHLDERIMARHHEVITAYNQLKASERRYVLKPWYLFYQYLVMEGHDVDQREIPLVKLKESLEQQNALIRRIAIILRDQGSKFDWNPVEVY
jgi:hypothetical protein